MTDSAPSPDATERQESLGGVFGIGLGLLVIAICMLGLALYGPRRMDAAEVLSQSFVFAEDPPALGFTSQELEGGAAPTVLRLEAQALTLAQGEQVFTFSDGVELEVKASEVIKPEGAGPGMQGKGKGKDEFEEFDLTQLDVRQSNALPSRLYLVRFPTSRAEAILNSQFRGLAWRDLSEISAKGGSSVIGGDKLRWAGYEADWVRQRRFIEGGSIRDTLRVNLSLGQECWIAYAIWPENEQGSEEVLRELLEGVQPKVQLLSE